MNQAQIVSTKKRQIESIDVTQLEYTAEKLFTYGTLAMAVVAICAAVIYGGASILYAGTKKLRE